MDSSVPRVINFWRKALNKDLKMTTYEACMLLRVLPKKETAVVLKRAAQAIFDKGGFLRNLENMGTRDIPYKTSIHGVVYKKASYFLMEFNVPLRRITDLAEEYGRDVDIIRRRIYKKQTEDNFNCTLNEELLPPPYRKSVQEVMNNVKKIDMSKFKYNTGLDYYPFQK